MYRKKWICVLLTAALLLSGCASTVEDMYAPPKRSEGYNRLQSAIDGAMAGMEYAAPVSGENRQIIQMADLNGDGMDEYILFARKSSDTPLQILVFRQEEDGECRLTETLESTGSAFEKVEYVDVDGEPGLEIVVGRQVSDQLQRTLSVYSFSSGEAAQLLSAGYEKYLCCDFDGDGTRELMVLRSGETEADKGYAVLYRCRDGEMQRSREAGLSLNGKSIKRIMVSRLHGGETAVFVASALEENAILTDVFALKDGMFTNISYSADSGNSVQTLRNYYVYGDDVNDDGILELPFLITMKSGEGETLAEEQHLIRWYALDIDGRQINKLHTYHNYVGGWYLELNSDWASRVSVTQEGTVYTFSLWDEGGTAAQELFTLYCFTGSSRETQAADAERFPLQTLESAVYAASLGSAADTMGITRDYLMKSFHLIHQDWYTGET